MKITGNLSNSIKNVSSIFSKTRKNIASMSSRSDVNSAEISRISKQLLENRENDQNKLSNISSEIGSIQEQLSLININLVNISNLLQKDSQQELEVLKEQSEKVRLSRSKESTLEREGELESNLEPALTKPLQKAEEKISSAFSSVQGIASKLFLSFLGIQGLKAFKANSEGNKEELKKILGRVLRNTAYFGTFMFSLKFGMMMIRRGLRSLVNRMTRSLTGSLKNILGSLKNKLLTGLRNKLNLPKKPITPPNTISAPKRKPPGTISTKGNKTIKDVLKGNKGPGAKPPLGTPGNTAIPKPSTGIKFPKLPKGSLKGVLKGSVSGFAIGADMFANWAGQKIGDKLFGTREENLERFKKSYDEKTPEEQEKISGEINQKLQKELRHQASPLHVADKVIALGDETDSEKKSKFYLEQLEAIGVSPKRMDFDQDALEKYGGIPPGYELDQSSGKIVKKSESESPVTSSDLMPDLGSTSTPTISTGSEAPSVASSDLMPDLGSTSTPTISTGSEAPTVASSDLMPTPSPTKFQIPEIGMDSDEEMGPIKRQTDPIDSMSPTDSMLSDKNIWTNISSKPKIDSNDISKMKPMEESPPNVIVMPSDEGGVSGGGVSEAETDVPLIRSYNPDNFYVLYSKINYNVVQ